MTSVHSAVDHRIFRKECRSLARAGFDVTVVGPHPDDTVAEQVQIKSIRKHDSRFARMTRTVWQVFQEAKKRDADVYHFHDPELIPVALLLRSRGKRVIYDIHEDYPKDILSKSYLPRWSRQFIAWLAERVETTTCRHFSALVAVVPSIAARFQAINSRIVIIYNYPYSEELIGEDSSSWESRKQAIAYVGTITPQRGIAEMVRAMTLLPHSVEATLELAGDEVPEEVKKMPGWSLVNHHGALDQLSTYKLLRQVRAGVICEHPISSFVESMPVKVFEYMGAGLPVIASNFPFWRKMLDGVECSLFVDPLNVQEIAQAIEYLLTHPVEAERMGRNGQAAVLSRFNWNTEAEKLVDLYVELVNQECAG